MTTDRDVEYGRAVKAALCLYTCDVDFWRVVERRDAEDMLPALVMPWWTKYAALGALVVAIWCHGWLKGAQGVREAWEAATAKQEAAALAKTVELAKRASELDAVWIAATTTIRERVKVLTKEVPIYVSPESDTRCSVPAGFIRLWDAHLQALYSPASGSGNDAPSGLALSDVGRGIVEAKERFELNKATGEACQAWVREITR